MPVGHTDWVNSAAFSPDGKLFLTASNDNTARIYDVATGKELQILIGHKGEIKSALFSRDGKLAITASWDNTSRIFQVISGQQLQLFSGHSKGVNSAEFNFDGSLVLTASNDDTARIFDVTTGNSLRKFSGQFAKFVNSNRLNSVAFSPNGKFVIVCENNHASIYNIDLGEKLSVLSGHSSSINSAVFSPDGNFILTASDDHTARIFEVFSGKEHIVLRGHSGSVRYAMFSPDGRLALTIGDNSLRIYDVLTGNKLKILSENIIGAHSAVFSSDGSLILAAGVSKASIFDVLTGKELRVLCDGQSVINSAVFSPNNQFALIANRNGTAHLYDVLSGKVLKIFTGYARILEKGVFISDDEIAIETRKFQPGTNFFGFDETNNIFFELSTGKQLEYNRYSNILDSLTLTRVGSKRLILSDATTIIYDVSSGKEIKRLTGHSDYIISATFSPDSNKVLTASRDRTARIYEIISGKELHVLKGHNGWLNSAIFSPDGKLVVTASDDNTARIYDVASGIEINTLNTHLDHVNSVAFSPDSKLVLTGSNDKTARIFQVSSGKEIQVFYGHSLGVIWAHFADKGSHVITISYDRKIIVWDVETGNPIYERIQLENNNWLVKLPNSPYYMCSKDASKMLHYVTPSLKVIGFDQLDPVYNRPDIVLDSISKYFGNKDQGMIDEYRKSWQKRIDRLGLDKEKLGRGEIAVPDAEIMEADNIAYENKDGNLAINVKANDPKYTLRRFNVYVNEVPLYGSEGISIASRGLMEWDTTISVPLGVGENKIQVSVMNELGLENFKYPTYVIYTPYKEIVARTHYIGIGVNEFQMKENNLTYCVKDVNDLAHALKDKNTRVKLYTNQKVTRENILALKQYLKDSTTVNDKVIISCSSHGLLDDSLNFYLATHDVDFHNPKARGLKYNELEELLDGIPARQKLLLLDACNSGENDKTELLNKELDRNKTTMDSAQVLASRGVIIKLEEENKNNFKKMNELFVNVRNNTGSVIISAAGGQESALEGIEVNGKKIENGAFTHCVLEYMKANEGQTDELTVIKLKQYVENRVEEITNGKQKPTSRQETMEVDWKLK
jgi:WD40 repeat protein